jgi:DNA-binding NtrC family response regulator
MCSGKILAIDDEPNIRTLIFNEFALEGFEVTPAETGEEGLQLFERQQFDLVLLDLKLPRISGLETLRQIKRRSPRAAVIMITGYGDISTAVEAIKLGARDYITKPFKLEHLLSLAKQAIKDNQVAEDWQKTQDLPETEGRVEFLRCPSKLMQGVYELIDKVAATDLNILIQGETGSGKDVLAMEIHNRSHRRQGPFVTLDCGLLARELAETELYGHRKGAFSGASESKTGLVEMSHGGTLFLDEIGNVDVDVQKKFLRFLETGHIRRVGETREIKIDARIILATNLPVEDAIQNGKFRSDLFYRIAEFSINIPPLRKRTEDILPLARYFLKHCNATHRPKEFSPETVEILTSYSWPGNVRELKSAINKIAILTESEIIRTEHLPIHLKEDRCSADPTPKSLEDVEKEHIIKVLAETGGNQTIASKILGINRKTLYKKLKKYKIFS